MTSMSVRKKKSPAQLDREIGQALSRSSKRASVSGAQKKRPKRPKRPKKLVVTFDVTGLSRDEIDGLTGAAVVQGEASDTYDTYGVDYPDVAVKSRLHKRGKRKLLAVEYDASDLSEAQLDALSGAVEAQADGGDGGLWIDGEPTSAVYPSVSFTTKVVR